MIALLLILSTVRAEPVEARAANTAPAARPSTSSGPTGTEITPVEAERAFAADAQRIGQWTAFRKWAAPDAIMFDPAPVKVSELLKDAKDPPQSVEWWPTASYVSCDGTMAVNTGGWKRPNGSVGYFTTIWQRQADGGWKWVVDSGDTLATGRSPLANPVIRKADCKPIGAVSRQVYSGPPTTGRAEDGSSDHSLLWEWVAFASGARDLTVSLYDGTRYVVVLSDRIEATPVRK